MNESMNFSQIGIDFLEAREGKKLRVYKDSAGRETIGIGHLLTAHDPVADWRANGITEEFCYEILQRDTAKAVHALNTLVAVSLNQFQFDALVSFTFNEGTHALATSTLLKYLNMGSFHDAAAQFLVWDKQHIDGVLKYSEGLHNRRLLEKELFLTPSITPLPVV